MGTHFQGGRWGKRKLLGADDHDFIKPGQKEKGEYKPKGSQMVEPPKNRGQGGGGEERPCGYENSGSGD